MLSLIPWKKSLSPAEESRMLPFTALRRELDPWFAPLLDPVWNDGRAATLDPVRLEVRETDDAYVVRAELPGLEPKDIEIQLQGEHLILAGEKRPEEAGSTREAEESCTYSERRFGAFRRVLHLAAPIDADRVKAEHRNGVLTVRLEKSAAARAKRIEVRAG
jgi:HSP20 family protein